ncbi:hypothetical protein [Oligoflexus tunisiensis]|uniref:hypothetical protein n=1 Tax=Oligoflexus tunisiensis TaxID=708132 RepID=UPI00114CCCDB|nr:hypothetical protein [Oligoflexus tunisiensis]
MKLTGTCIISAILLLAGAMYENMRTGKSQERPKAAISRPAAESPKPISFAPLVQDRTETPDETPTEAETTRLEALTVLLEGLRANPEARPHLEAVIDYIKNAPPDMFSVRNLPSDDRGLAVLDGNSSRAMIKDERVRVHWQALMDIIGKTNQ